MNLDLKKIHPFVWIFLLGIAVWGWTVSFGFVWDDFPMIVNNPSLETWKTILSGWSHDFWMLHESPQVSGYWRPVPTMIHVLLAQLFGKNPWVFHLLNVLLHIGTACAFYVFIRNLGLVRWVWLPVVFFLVHPIQSEAVSFSSAVPDLLCAFFGWMALAAWSQKNQFGLKKITIVFIYLSLCFLSKESGVFFGVFLIFLSTLERSEMGKIKFSKAWVGGVIVLSALYVFIHIQVIGNIGVRRIWGEGFAEHIATVSKLFGYQLYLLLFPFGSSPTRDFKIVVSFADPSFWLGAILLVLMVGGVFYAWKKKNHDWLIISVGFLIFWFPVSNILPAEGLIADRYLYVLVMIFGLSIAKIFSNMDRPPIILFVILVVLGVMTYFQSLAWMNQVYLWSHAVKTSPHSSVAWNEYGGILLQQKKFPEASAAYENAYRLRPFYREASFNRALVPYFSKDLEGAKKLLVEHLQQFSSDDQAYDLLGAIYEAESNFTEAVEASKTAVRISPNQWKYRYNLAEVYLQKRDYTNAILELQAAYDLVQNRFEILKNLGLAYFQNGQYHEARDTYAMFMRKFPDKAGEVRAQFEKSEQIIKIMEGS